MSKAIIIDHPEQMFFSQLVWSSREQTWWTQAGKLLSYAS